MKLYEDRSTDLEPAYVNVHCGYDFGYGQLVEVAYDGTCTRCGEDVEQCTAAYMEEMDREDAAWQESLLREEEAFCLKFGDPEENAIDLELARRERVEDSVRAADPLQDPDFDGGAP